MVIPWHAIGRPAGNLFLALVGVGCASLLGIPDLLVGLGTLPIPEIQLPLVAIAAVWVLNQIAKTILDAKKGWNEINKGTTAGELAECLEREKEQCARVTKLESELATVYVMNAQKDKQITHHIEEKKSLLEIQAMLTIQLADRYSVHRVEVVNPPSEPIPVTPTPAGGPENAA